MTFLELQQGVYADCGYSATPPPDVQTRVKRWLNQAQHTLLRMPVLAGQRDGTLDLTSIPGEGVYGIPQAFTTIDRIVQKSNNRRLVYRTRDWFRAADPGETSTGVPDVWIPEGRQPVERHPQNQPIVTFSDRIEDTTQIVRVAAVFTNGEINYLSATLQGKTPVTLTPVGAIDWRRIVSWTLSAPAIGRVYLSPPPDAITYAMIPAGQTHVTYQGIRLWPTPTDALAYTIDGQLVITNMANDTDVPMISDDWHDMLMVWARRCEYERTGDRRFSLTDHDWNEAVAGLKSASEFPADYRPVAGKFSGRVGINNLGGWYPPDYFI